MDEPRGLEYVSTVTPDLFARWVQSAVRQLYDFPALERHPLAELLGGPSSNPTSRAQELRRLLLDGVQAMRPDASIPSDAPDWRGYRILQMRFIEGLTPDEAMERLALQKTQYYSDQSRTLRALANRLWELYQSHEKTSSQAPPISPDNLIRSERERFSAQAMWEEIDAGPLLDELRRVLDPLVAAHRAILVTRYPLSLVIKRAKRVLLRQAVLQAASYALDLCPEGSLEIAGIAEGSRVGLRVRAWTTRPCPGPEIPGQATRLEVCGQLMTDMGGKLETRSTGAAWEADLVWENAALPMLLVVDDNEGFADLFQRYLTGYPWRVVGAASGTEAQQLIHRTQPTVIILDVLMPQEDGWELLIALKADPATRAIPVIVCSVLRESSIALSLGAASFLPKPVTEKSLVQALEPWSIAPGNG